MQLWLIFSVKFTFPLEKTGVESGVMKDEWKDTLDYAKRYLNLVPESSQVIWWKLFNASCSRKWSNVLSLIELRFFFCIPVSNGHVERVFKSDLRSSLSVLRLWWKDKQRRQVQVKRAPCRKPSEVPDEVEQEASDQFTLDD